MTDDRRSTKKWMERVPAVVFGCLLPDELRIVVQPGVGMADGGIPLDVAINKIPVELRFPNTRLWIQFDGKHNVVRAWRRHSDE
jgi:hypothetical protein